MIAWLERWLWGGGLCVLLLGTGVYYTVLTGGLPFRRRFLWLRRTIGALSSSFGRGKGVFSPFEAVSTALGATMGTGNLVGVASALSLGGAGALVWMWLSGLVGMSLKYGEIYLSLRFRQKGRGRDLVGPMAYLERGLSCRPLARAYGFFGLLAAFTMGGMSQSKAVAEGMAEAFGCPSFLCGAFLCGAAAFVILGGSQMVGKVSAVLVPVLFLGYLAMGLCVLWVFRASLWQTVQEMVADAFSMEALFGGSGAAAIQYGMARGVFSHEAGLGTATLAYGEVETKEPAQAALWGIFEVFADTMVVCTLTGLCILVTGVLETGQSGAALTMAAFETVFGAKAKGLLAAALALFAFSTVISWFYYGSTCAAYLWGRTSSSKFGAVFLALVFLGVCLPQEMVWRLTDGVNALLAFPNLTALLLLSPLVWQGTRAYLKKEAKK